jgi:hypothetical protein
MYSLQEFFEGGDDGLGSQGHGNVEAVQFVDGEISEILPGVRRSVIGVGGEDFVDFGAIAQVYVHALVVSADDGEEQVWRQHFAVGLIDLQETFVDLVEDVRRPVSEVSAASEGDLRGYQLITEGFLGLCVADHEFVAQFPDLRQGQRRRGLVGDALEYFDGFYEKLADKLME